MERLKVAQAVREAYMRGRRDVLNKMKEVLRDPGASLAAIREAMWEEENDTDTQRNIAEQIAEIEGKEIQDPRRE